MSETLKDIGLKNTVSIAVRRDGCFQLLPTADGRKQREYYRPHNVENDYRELVKKYGPDNVKIFREIEVVLQLEDDHSEYLEYKREIMEMDEKSAAMEDD